MLINFFQSYLYNFLATFYIYIFCLKLSRLQYIFYHLQINIYTMLINILNNFITFQNISSNTFTKVQKRFYHLYIVYRHLQAFLQPLQALSKYESISYQRFYISDSKVAFLVIFYHL